MEEITKKMSQVNLKRKRVSFSDSSMEIDESYQKRQKNSKEVYSIIKYTPPLVKK